MERFAIFPSAEAAVEHMLADTLAPAYTRIEEAVAACHVMEGLPGWEHRLPVVIVDTVDLSYEPLYRPRPDGVWHFRGDLRQYATLFDLR